MDILLENSYLLPIAFAIFLVLVNLLSYAIQNQKKDPRLIYDINDAPFDNALSNKLYQMSYSSFFGSFLPESADMPKAQDQDKMFAESGFATKLNYRVFGTVQIMLFIAAFAATFLIGGIMALNPWIVKLLFNIEMAKGEFGPFLFIGMILILLCLVPTLFFKSKANSRHAGFIKDLPILQLFIVLMLKSQRSTAEILYTLGKTNTRYREIFDIAYRISIRSQTEAFDYLRNAFAGTAFVDTITILATSEEYSKQDSIEVLEGRIDSLIQDVENIKGEKGVIKGLLSEGSIALPMIGLMVLVVVPILIYAMNMMNTAGNGII